MKYGLAGINVGGLAVPAVGRIAELAEELGYESVWTAEHIVLPDLPAGQTERPGAMPMLDSLVMLGYVAARTHTLRLATGVLLLPQHEPLLLAKQLASLDVVCEGRLIVGLGVGGVEAEAKALGVPMSERGARAGDYVRAMQAVWTMEHPSYAGKYATFEGINAFPRPVQQPHPPLVFGGRAPAVLRRTLRYGAGWYGWGMDVEGTRSVLASLAAAAQTVQRPAGLGKLEITIAPRESLTPDVIAAYHELGVERLLLRLPSLSPLEDIEAAIRGHAPEKLGQPS